jgi:hypothetical protein
VAIKWATRRKADGETGCPRKHFLPRCSVNAHYKAHQHHEPEEAIRNLLIRSSRNTHCRCFVERLFCWTFAQAAGYVKQTHPRQLWISQNKETQTSEYWTIPRLLFTAVKELDVRILFMFNLSRSTYISVYFRVYVQASLVPQRERNSWEKETYERSGWGKLLLQCERRLEARTYAVAFDIWL